MTITHLNNKAIAVTGLPDANRFKIFNDENPYLSYFIGVETFRLYLPPGNWTILGFSKDLKEEDWKRVVEEITFKSNIIKSYRNYERPMPQWIYACSTALLSAHSLLKSKDLDPLLNHLILINDESH